MRSKVIFGYPKWPLQPFCEKKELRIGVKCLEMRSVIQNGRRQPFCENKIKVVYFSEMARNVIEIHFRSSKMGGGGGPGGGGGGHHNGQAVNHSGIYTVFALGQIHQF